MGWRNLLIGCDKSKTSHRPVEGRHPKLIIGLLRKRIPCPIIGRWQEEYLPFQWFSQIFVNTGDWFPALVSSSSSSSAAAAAALQPWSSFCFLQNSSTGLPVLATIHHCLTPIFRLTSTTPSSHLNLGRPILFLPSGLHYTILISLEIRIKF